MANLNIPANPSVGTTYEENGVIYTWTGTHWTASVIETYASGPLAGFRNQIINGGMEIHQRGTSGTDTSTKYLTADRWMSNNNSTSTVFNDASLVPIGFAKALRVNRSTGAPWVAQGIELPLLTNGNYRAPGPFVEDSVWTISWWTKQTVDTPTVTFNDGVAVTANPVVHTVDAPVAIQTEGAWTRYSSKVTMALDTSQSADRCLRVIMKGGVGANTDFEVVGVQLEPGPVATPFEYRPIGTELALCQRYYQVMGEVATSMPGSAVGNDLIYTCPYTTSMRAIPTASFNAKYGTVDTVITKLGSFILANGASDGNNRYGVDNLTFDAEL